MFAPSLLSIACQYASEFESALFSYFVQCVYNVFKPVKLFTWKFLNRLGNWKFKSPDLAVFKGDTYHFQQQKSYNKENISKHFTLKCSLTGFSRKEVIPYCLTPSHLCRRKRFCAYFLKKTVSQWQIWLSHCCIHLLLWLTENSNWKWKKCLSGYFLVIHWLH